MRVFFVIFTALFLAVTPLPAGAGDTAGDEIYSLLMDRILGQKLGWTANSSSTRPGDKNPYRDGIPGASHKALAACMVWDYSKVEVDYRSWHASGHADWSYAEFNALKGCANYKRQKQFDCKCQVVDHDDENVLKVPNDFLARYQAKLAKKTQ
jgi:hypothetical protein